MPLCTSREQWEGMLAGVCDFHSGCWARERNSPSWMFDFFSRAVYTTAHSVCGSAPVSHSHSEIHQVLKHTGVQRGNAQYITLPALLHCVTFSSQCSNAFVSSLKFISKSERGRGWGWHCCFCKSCPLFICNVASWAFYLLCILRNEAQSWKV